MKKHSLIIALIAASLILHGCQCSFNGSQAKSGTFEENTYLIPEPVVAETDDAEPEAPAALSAEDIEAFYHSLPVLALPADWRSMDEETMIPVPERIYISPVFGFEYPLEVVGAARLPEKDGVRRVLVHIEDGSDYVSMYLFAFRASDMEFTDRLLAYDVREIDGGDNTLVSSFEIGRDLKITLTAEYFGKGDGGEPVRVPFRKEYLTLSPEGRFEAVNDGKRETISYVEEKYEYEGEYYGNYNFTIITYRPAYLEEKDVWEIQE